MFQQLLDGLRQTTLLEFVAVIFGIISVLLSRKEHIGVYPTGIVNTAIYIYLCLIGGLYAEAGVNLYYTIMSVVGWAMWLKKGDDGAVLAVSVCSKKENAAAFVFFFGSWLLLYLVLRYFTNSTVPLSDSFASATAYTGMWLMAKKKLENWLWWIATDVASIPLYYVKGYAFTGFQYLVFLFLAISGYFAWKEKLRNSIKNPVAGF